MVDWGSAETDEFIFDLALLIGELAVRLRSHAI